MFCENCGKEIPNNATFCTYCGCRINNRFAKPMFNDKSMGLALVLSFIVPGLGIIYAGDKKKGLILLLIYFVMITIGFAISIFAVIGIMIWAYSLFETYNQVKIANGVSNPNLIEDFKSFPTSKKIGVIIVIAILFLIVVGSAIAALSPKENISSDDDYDSINDDYTTLDSSSEDSDSDSYSGDSYSSSSYDGQDVSSHYEDEYGSADIDGRVNDDGSVDAHQTGHTDYGDYEIDSHMDSDGNIHGTVTVNGRTYHVDG